MTRLLFVDDDPLVLRGLQRLLSAHAADWELAFVSGGREALQILEKEPFEVVVTDVRMPGMNGADLLAELARRHPHVARIVLSGQADQAIVFECLTLAHQYLLKPCEPDDLVAAVRRVVAAQALGGSRSTLASVGRLQRLPRDPDLYRKIEVVMASDPVDLGRWAGLMETDVALTAKLLKLANSAYFGLHRNVETVADAVASLGVEVLRTVIVRMQTSDPGRELEYAGVAAREVGRRSLLTAVAARALARLEGQPRAVQDGAFTAGMLHLCGHLVLANDHPETFARLLSRARAERVALGSLEREAYGVADGQVAACLLGLWGVPAPIVDAVVHHALDTPRPYGAVTFVHAAQALVGELLPADDGWPAAPLNRVALAAAGVADREALWRSTVAAAASAA